MLIPIPIRDTVFTIQNLRDKALLYLEDASLAHGKGQALEVEEEPHFFLNNTILHEKRHIKKCTVLSICIFVFYRHSAQAASLLQSAESILNDFLTDTDVEVRKGTTRQFINYSFHWSRSININCPPPHGATSCQ